MAFAARPFDDSGQDTLAPEAPDPAFLADVLQGLAQSDKAVPARWFYDMRGSQLFEEITRLPEYYPTRTETELLRRHAPEIARRIGNDPALVEFGSGSSVKTRILLNHMPRATYVPIDICGEFLDESCRSLQELFPELHIVPVEADFTKPVALPQIAGGADGERMMMGFFPGSTIGNMAPEAAVDLLRSIRNTLGPRSSLLIGIDRVKDTRRLVAAYDDAQGVTAQFNLNLLTRMNRELGATIPVDAFSHVALWNEQAGRIEMHLRANRPVRFRVHNETFAMERGETIHTENCHKYRPGEIRLMLAAGGWTESKHWSDPDGDFSLVLADASVDAVSA
jgi:probable methyltransferase